MAKRPAKRYKQPVWPRPRFPWEGWNRPAWLILNPVTLAPPGGVLFAMLALSYYLLLQWLGYSMSPQDVLVGVALVFVAGYAATGIFVWYVLRVAWRELPDFLKGRRPSVTPAPSASESSKAEASATSAESEEPQHA